MDDDASGANSGKKAKHSYETSGGFKVIKEGKAEILVRGSDVFYNKAQVIPSETF